MANRLIMIVGPWGSGKTTLSRKLCGGFKGWARCIHGDIGHYMLSPDERLIYMGQVHMKNAGTDSVSVDFGRKIVAIASVFDNKTIILEGNKIYGKHIEDYIRQLHEVLIITMDYEYADYIGRRIKRSGGTFEQYDTEKRRKNFDSKRKTYLNLYDKFRYNESVRITRIDANRSEEEIEKLARSFIVNDPYATI